jgi:hypothetical protein
VHRPLIDAGASTRKDAVLAEALFGVKHFRSPSRSISVLVTLIVCAMLSACGPNALAFGQQSKAASSNLSAQSSAQLITQLQQAKTLNENNANDPTISLPRRGDFLNHATQADLAIRDLQHGFFVPEDRITYALEVPPKHLAPEQRAALIQQLKDAIRKDDSREQAVVSWSDEIYNEDPGASSEFGDQEQLAQKEIRNLEEGDHVSWDELQRALYVPPDYNR